MRVYINIAFSNPLQIMSWNADGITMRDSSELTPDEAAMIQKVTYRKTATGSNLSVKLHDKKKALDNLAKHLGMFNDGGR